MVTNVGRLPASLPIRITCLLKLCAYYISYMKQWFDIVPCWSSRVFRCLNRTEKKIVTIKSLAINPIESDYDNCYFNKTRWDKIYKNVGGLG